MLGELPSPVGVFFESECIFSLKEDSQMALSFQATMAQEESHTRSRSMETSLRMRLDGGLPLTPKPVSYTHLTGHRHARWKAAGIKNLALPGIARVLVSMVHSFPLKFGQRQQC